MNTRAGIEQQTERQIAEAPVPRFELDAWRAMGLRAGITGKAGDFDLGLFADGRAGAVMDHWLAFEATQRPDFRSLGVARQVHGAVVHHHSETIPGWQVSTGFDGHLTAARGLLLAVTVADCIPIYLAHRDSGTIALLHAGWRGTAAGILENGVRALQQLAECRVSNIVMHCGVGICGECYEVGPEVVAAIHGRQVSRPERLDLRAVLVDRAGRLGLEQVTASTWCSSHDMEFFSHRRSRGSDGRMAAYLGVPGIRGSTT